MHPIERLRAVARARGVDQRLLAREAATVLGVLADDPFGLVMSCRRLLDRHPGAGALWWVCARLLDAADPRVEARAVTRALGDDDAVLRPLTLDLPERSTVVVVPDAAGGSELVDRLAVRREDLVPVEAADPALDVAAVIEAGASLAPTDPFVDARPFGPRNPLAPVDPVGPVDPVTPVDPVAPVDPAGPSGTGDPVGAGERFGDTDPFAPSDPIGPRDPIGPAGPLGPSGAAGRDGPRGREDRLGSAGAVGASDRLDRDGRPGAARQLRAGDALDRDDPLARADPLSRATSFGAPGTGTTVVLVEAGAAGPDRFLAVPGTAEGLAVARARAVPVWLVVGPGARLPGPLFDAAAARASGYEVIAVADVDRVIEPRTNSCPCPPELLRTWGV